MVKASSKAPYCLICGKQIPWQDKVTVITYTYRKVEYPIVEVKRFVSDKTHFHRKCFNNSEFAKVLGKDEVNNGS